MQVVPMVSAGDVALGIEALVSGILDGAVVCAPSESGYALLAGAYAVGARRRVRALRGLEESAAPQILLAHAELMGAFARVTPSAIRTAAAMWPGMVSVLLDTGGYQMEESGSVILRQPADLVLARLTREAGPLMASRALVNGQFITSATQAAELELDLFADAGSILASTPSTILDCRSEPPMIIRSGVMAIEDAVVVDPTIVMGA